MSIIDCCLESSSSRNPLRKGEEKRMANHKIFVPFPIWDLLEKQEEIAEMLKNELGVHPPRGTPRGIKFKSVPRGKDECDRLKVILWYPLWGYVIATIGGWTSTWGTGWSLVGYQARWTETAADGQVFSCSIEAGEETVAAALEAAAHCYAELISVGTVRKKDVDERIDEFKSFDAFKEVGNKLRSAIFLMK